MNVKKKIDKSHTGLRSVSKAAFMRESSLVVYSPTATQTFLCKILLAASSSDFE